MATKIQLETRIRELERRLENDEQDMVEVCERIEKLEGERDEYKKSSNDWARHFKLERTARISAEAEVARLRRYLDCIAQVLQYEGNLSRERAEVLEIIGEYETEGNEND